MNNSNLDAGIPVLTEIIPPVERGVSDHAITTSPKPSAQSPKEEQVSSKAPTLESLTAEQLRHVENEVMERVLQQLLGRIDFVLEQRVRDSLADVLQTTVEGLATEIRQGLQQTLEDVIARAVTQEITRLQTTKK